MIDPREHIARLRGQVYIPEPVLAPVIPAAHDPITELLSMVFDMKQEISQMKQQISQQNARRDKEYRTLSAIIQDLNFRLETHTSPVNTQSVQSVQFPAIEQIVKMRAQIFHNTGKGNVHRVLKFNVWTKGANDVNGDSGYLAMNMYQPCTRSSRKFLGDSLDYLNANEADLLGCISPKYGQKLFDQSAFIMPDSHLFVVIRDEPFNFGLGRVSPDHWKPNAPKATWYWPDGIH